MRKNRPIAVTVLAYIVAGALGGGIVYVAGLIWPGSWADRDYPLLMVIGWSLGAVIFVPLIVPFIEKNGAQKGGGSERSSQE